MESVLFEVISWYHNFPKENPEFNIPNPLFGAKILNDGSKKTIGVKINWSFIIMHKGLTTLKYSAHEDFLSKDKSIKKVTIQEIQGIVRLSHLKYRKEFDKIKIGFNLGFTIPPYQEADINYQDLIDLFQL
jgi:hypothetical protein